MSTSPTRPAAGQVVIATEAVGVGGVDTVIRSGALAAYGSKEGHIPGSEVAGTVTAVGDGVDTCGSAGVCGVHRRPAEDTSTALAPVEQIRPPARQTCPLPPR